MEENKTSFSYEELIYISEIAEEDSILFETEKLLSNIEDENPNYLKEAAIYMLHLPSDHTEAFTVCVLGADGHAIAHLIEIIYPQATVYWIANNKRFDNCLANDVSYMIFSGRVSNGLLEDDSPITVWTANCLKWGGHLICSTLYSEEEKYELYNYFAFRGLNLEAVDSNGLAVADMLLEPQSQSDMSNNAPKQRWDKIYVICPAHVKSGGSELLHQLVYWINRLSGNANIVYSEPEPMVALCHPELIHYVAGHITLMEDICDTKGNAVIVPEGWSSLVTKFELATIMLWWLSVDNYMISCGADSVNDAQRLIKIIQDYIYLNLTQSAYARDFLLKNGVDEGSIRYLGDYINDGFLVNNDGIVNIEKRDIVLYNPKKGIEYVHQLMECGSDISWVSIDGLKTGEVAELLRSAKVYIDFGNHPGKDRIPREAAVSGCIVITGRRGSAGFYEDVPIPDNYKISEKDNSIEDVVRFIRDCIAHYDALIHDFDDYRTRICEEKEEFVKDVKKLFFM